MRRLQLLDLFCGAQGAGEGYVRAGFLTTGVDREDHPDAPGRVIVKDAFEVLADQDFLSKFDVVHASPPCQGYTTMSNRHRGAGGKADEHDQSIGRVRNLLRAWGGAYVIENVPGARRDMVDPITLHGGMFGLRVYRPRLFETNLPLTAPSRAPKPINPIGVYGKSHDGRRLFTRRDGSIQRAAASLEEGRAAMGIGWMAWHDLTEAIPPHYTEYLGRQIHAHLTRDWTCTLILHATQGGCHSCGRSVTAPEWNRSSAPSCYWCGDETPIPCASPCGCIAIAQEAVA